MIKVVLLGAGNVGTHLFRVLHQAKDISLIQWYNRSEKALEEGKNLTTTTTNLQHIVAADLYLIAVADAALQEVSQALEHRKGLIAHTAGSVPMNQLKKHNKHGVFYPLQSFSKQKQVDFNQIPLCLEANTPANLSLLKKVAHSLGGPIHFIDSTQRKALHIAAVFVNNFTNHLYTIGHNICQKEGMPFSILQPLIKETADKIAELSPMAAQTGPALRKDQKTITHHIEQLTSLNQKKLYESLTNSIQHYHGR